MGKVLSLSSAASHAFSKSCSMSLEIVAGYGVKGDAHFGEKVQHLSRIAKNPETPNLRQVHLIHSELFEELAKQGFDVQPGDLGENILTKGVALLDLPEGTRLHIGPEVILELTGLRNPCKQIDAFQKGLMHALIEKDEVGNLIRKAGVMSIALQGGMVRRGDPIVVKLPNEPTRALQPV